MDNANTINGAALRDMYISGAAMLEHNKELVDSLNVFPVPDGDTGTNMFMTINAAVKELRSVEGDNPQLASVANAMAKGALRGARGNSGVILSQLFRGMARVLEKNEIIDGVVLADALLSGSEAAYKAVMKPKEGTILTVAKHVALKAAEAAENGANAYSVVDIMIHEGENMLAKTPEMLPVLKEAGVVDSGGKGLVLIYRGFKLALDGDVVESYAQEQSEAVSDRDENALLIENADAITFGYCTEFFIQRLEKNVGEADVDKLRDSLMRIGDSVVAVFDTDFVKIHVHTNTPGKALQLALRLGEIDCVKIENMREQNRKLMAERKANEKELGLVAIGVGSGIEKVFKDLAVEIVVSGGQTMNPSAEDIQRAVRRANARNVIVLPNNKNIVLAANQAREMLMGAVNVIVIPTSSISQGITAALTFDASGNPAEIEQAMKEAITGVKSGQVTKAVRSTSIKGIAINEGDFIGMLDGDITSSDAQIGAVLDKLMEEMLKDGGDYVTVFYGEEIREEDAAAFAHAIEDAHPDMDVVLQYGGQPLYHYLISVE